MRRRGRFGPTTARGGVSPAKLVASPFPKCAVDRLPIGGDPFESGSNLISVKDETQDAVRLLDYRHKKENNMTRYAKPFGLIVTAALLTAAPLSPHYSPANLLTVSVNSAEARIGRPLTPMSVAGVNRRVHRRAYYGAAAVGVGAAAAYGAYGYRRACGYYPYPPCY